MNLRKATQANKVSWTVVAAAGKQWAAKVFPELPEEKQVEALWDQIFKTTRVYEEDPVLAWKKHDEKLAKSRRIESRTIFCPSLYCSRYRYHYRIA